jgi:serine O-acetyltransferase
MTMTGVRFMFLVRSDLYRYEGTTSAGTFLRHLVRTPGFRYIFILRLCAYLNAHRVFRFGLRQLMSFVLTRHEIRYGISIPYTMHIGPGFYIGHFGGIVVNENATIGKNCNLSHGVTIGQTNRGARKGCPQIGDNVYIGPGAILIGRIAIGNNVAVGANSVVTKDIPDNAVVAGVPGKIISMKGSAGYINRTDYI